MKQNLERLSVDPSNPLRIVMERYPDIVIGDHAENHSMAPDGDVAAIRELVASWNAIVERQTSLNRPTNEDIMTEYRISEATGIAHWTIQAANPSDALDKLAQKHGYKDHAHACTEIGIAAQTLIVAE